MSFPTETVLNFLGGSGFYWLLLAGLLSSLALGRYAWRKGRSSGTHDIWLGAAAMLACFVAWAVFSVLFHLGKLPPRLWMAPFDRLFVIACLVALGWALTATLQGAAQWRRFLIAGLFATVLAYAAWAPLWAREFHSRPWLVGDPTGLARVWDAWQVVLGLAVIVAVLRRTRRAPGWVLGALVGLIVASVLELFVPLSPVFPAWSRLGTLVAGTFFVGAAVTQVVSFPHQPVAARWPTWLTPASLRMRATTAAAAVSARRTARRQSPNLTDTLAAIESQATTLTHISQSVDSLSARVGHLETAIGTGGTTGLKAGTAQDTDPVEAAADAMRSLGRPGGDVDEALVGSLTEALRAPMTMILGYSDLLARGAGLTDEQLERFLMRIDANLARMQVMLGNLVTVVHQDHGVAETSAPKAELVDVQKALDTAVRRARPQLAEKGLAIKVDVPDDLEPASAATDAVRRILDNLLVNACQRSPQGGDITIEAAVRQDQHGRRAMIVTAHDRGKQLTGASGLTEIDDGPSTPAALKIVRLLADAQGGGAWAETDTMGARFFVRLPVAPQVA